MNITMYTLSYNFICQSYSIKLKKIDIPRIVKLHSGLTTSSLRNFAQHIVGT